MHISGLVGRTDLNGRQGTALSFNEESQRFTILVDREPVSDVNAPVAGAAVQYGLYATPGLAALAELMHCKGLFAEWTPFTDAVHGGWTSLDDPYCPYELWCEILIVLLSEVSRTLKYDTSLNHHHGCPS